MLPGAMVQVVNGYVSSHNIDLIVMATAKTTGFMEFIFGSDAQRITSRATCPVLTMDAHTLTGSVQKIIFPVEDFYPENKLQYAIELAQLFNAEIHLICLSEKSSSPVYNTYSIITHIVEIFEEKKIRYKAKAAKGKNITQAILQYAEIESIDLILVNPGEESKLTGRFIETTGGSIVNHTSVPVLTIKKGELNL
ncbi:MAG: universal stress protein [Chitinophagaceae bacterium]|nr:universal stress protein [Chitinophagaceae bacterium]